MDKLKAMLASLGAKAVENKELLIRVGAVAAGVVIGAVVVTVIANQSDEYLLEEVLMEAEETDETEQ